MDAQRNSLAPASTETIGRPLSSRRAAVRDTWRVLRALARRSGLATPVRRAQRRPVAAGLTIGVTASALALKHKRYESGLHFIASGELDSATAPQLKQQCERLDPDEVGTVLLDLADLTLIDSSGLDVLTAAHAHLGERLVIIIGPPCADPIDIARARDRLPIIEG